MKRGLVFTLCAAALVVGSNRAHAQANVQVSLNLRYTDPADPTEGGTWFLVAKTDDPDGIAAVNAYISNIDTTGMSYGAGGTNGYPTVTAANLGAILDGTNPYFATFGSAINVVYGQDTATGPIVADVGQGAGTPGNVATDPLRNTAWNNSAVIANGTFGGTRPAFVTSGANETDGNTLAGTTLNVPSPAANVTTVVRGDSFLGLGLNDNPAAGIRLGDVDRNGLTNLNDFGGLSANFGPVGGKGWDQGDFNDDGFVNLNDFGALSASFGMPAPPAPAVGAASSVPEPSAVVLLGLALLGLGHRVKRS